MPYMVLLKVKIMEVLEKYFRCVKLKMRRMVQNFTPSPGDRVNFIIKMICFTLEIPVSTADTFVA